MTNLRDELKSKKPVIGLERNLKMMRNSSVKRVYVASNFNARENITAIGKSIGIEVSVVSENSKELGVMCKKPFSISVLGFE